MSSGNFNLSTFRHKDSDELVEEIVDPNTPNPLTPILETLRSRYSQITENIIKDICQVEIFLNKVDNIGKINIPKPPHAVTRPAALLLFSFGKCFEIMGVRMVPAAPAKPKPTNKPRLICSHMPEI